MLLEYLISLNRTEQIEKLAQSRQNQPITEEIEHVQKFIESHTNILTDGTRRAIFAIGVCVGILLEVQEQRYNKTAPFWNRLSRLDLDLERIIQLLPDVKSKLAMYNERGYNTVIDYLGANEVSRIDTSSSVSNDNLNLLFSVGLSYGYMLKRGYLK
jgi:CRISPR-associated protein Cas8b/Csh1 subtype I-B